MSGNREGFLARWSRLKRDTAAASPSPPAPAASPAAPAAPAPELPPVDSLSLDSDFSAFLQPKVEEGLKRQALRKLFSDPHFNQMDGLDVYIDDYTIPDPLPEGMLENLTQYRTLMGQPEEPAAEVPDAEQLPATGPAGELPAEAAGQAVEQPLAGAPVATEPAAADSEPVPPASSDKPA